MPNTNRCLYQLLDLTEQMDQVATMYASKHPEMEDESYFPRPTTPTRSLNGSRHGKTDSISSNRSRKLSASHFPSFASTTSTSSKKTADSPGKSSLEEPHHHHRLRVTSLFGHKDKDKKDKAAHEDHGLLRRISGILDKPKDDKDKSRRLSSASTAAPTTDGPLVVPTVAVTPPGHL